MNSLLDLIHNTALQVAITIVVASILHVMLRNTIDRVVMRVVVGHKYASKEEEQKREQTLTSIFHTAGAVVLWTAVIIVVLYQFHVNIAALLTGAGLLGVVIGFGAQNTIKDYLAGIFIITENQYRVGDIVSLYAGGKEVAGVVEDITIRITRLRDLDGYTHIVQNGSAGVVTNLSFKFANVNLDLDVSYDTEIEKAIKVINQVGMEQAGDDKWKSVIIEPIQFLRVDSFKDSSVGLKALGKVHPPMQWDVAGDFRFRIKKAFEKNGIVIPFPQVVVHQPKKKS